MNSKIATYLLAALVAVPLAANAQYVYDFTGIVDSQSGLGVTIGSQITGTYTFDYANGNNSGNVGSANSIWSVASNYFYPTVVFSTTAQSGQFYYHTASTNVESYVIGGPILEPPVSSDFRAFETTNSPIGGGAHSSAMDIQNVNGAYTSQGLPILAGADNARGSIEIAAPGSEYQSYVNFYFTSLTRAPELDAASAAGGLTLLACALTMVMGAWRRSESAIGFRSVRRDV